ncbi:MAG: hypothetical protein KJ697_04350 [Nanoarchaeota archaeon]|nr:hypothetical protein [Nanoarchaeota archaeon]MBU4123921.1 hypothetical protein [Nanoarchaeota archaeon]
MWLNPFTLLGALSIPFLLSNLATFIGFLLATYFSITYTLKFFEGRPKSLSWILIISGLASFCISEFGQFLMPYMENPVIITSIIILIAQNFGVISIAVGCFLLYKEVM